MVNGTARNAPIGPHSHAQNASASRIASGLSVSRWPNTVGLINWPSIVAADECRRRHERITERGKTHEPDAEQDQRRARGADVGDIIERHGYKAQGPPSPSFRRRDLSSRLLRHI